MHNFKKFLKTITVIAVCILILVMLDMALYPCTFMRNDIHAVVNNQYDDIILGTSHGMTDIDPAIMEEITGRSGHNMCVGGEYEIDAYYIAKLIAEEQKPSRIISEKEEGNNYLLFYHEFPFSKSKAEYFWNSIAKCNFRTILFPWYEYSLSYELGKVKETFSQKWNRDYDISHLKSATQEYHESGFIERYPVDTSKLKMEDLKLFDKKQINTQNLEYLGKLIDFCKENGIEFVAVTTPVPIDTLRAYSDNFNEAWKYFGEYFDERGITYLNGKAAEEYSRVLANILNKK